MKKQSSIDKYIYCIFISVALAIFINLIANRVEFKSYAAPLISFISLLFTIFTLFRALKWYEDKNNSIKYNLVEDFIDFKVNCEIMTDGLIHFTKDFIDQRDQRSASKFEDYLKELGEVIKSSRKILLKMENYNLDTKDVRISIDLYLSFTESALIVRDLIRKALDKKTGFTVDDNNALSFFCQAMENEFNQAKSHADANKIDSLVEKIFEKK